MPRLIRSEYSSAPTLVFSSLAGSVATALIPLCVTPLYIRVLGLEAYGLIGLYQTFQVLCMVFDVGVSSCINRELARLSADPANTQEMRDLVRTFEILYVGVGVLIGVVALAAAPLIAAHWIHPTKLGAVAAEVAIRGMAVTLAARWPISFYSGGLLGLQHHGLLYLVNFVAMILQSGGAAIILCWVSPTISSYFCWQAATGALQTPITALLLWHCLDRGARRARFDFCLLKKTIGFASHLGLTAVLGMVIGQLDQLILSRTVSLEAFGLYSIANSVTVSLNVIARPVFAAFYPRYTRTAVDPNSPSLPGMYHRSSQLMSVLIFSCATVLILCARDLVLLWTGNVALADGTHTLIALLAVAGALNALIQLPYALQLAHGWTMLGIKTNTVFLIVFSPVIAAAVYKYGQFGAAGAKILLNCGYVSLFVLLTHKRLLKAHASEWYRADVGVPLIGALIGGISVKLLVGWVAPNSAVASIIMTGAASFCGAAAAAPRLRRLLMVFVQQRVNTAFQH
jgi:O-antigen/teichoic acid export membrane protein